MKNKKLILVIAGIFFLFTEIKKNPDKVLSYLMSKKKLLDKIFEKYGNYIDKYSAMFGVPRSIIISVIATESSGFEGAKGSAGEIGLMQITPIALKQVNQYFKKNFTSDDLKVGEKNIIIGTYMLSYLWHRFKDWDLVIRAYNYGEGNIKKNPSLAQNYFDKVKGYQEVFNKT